MFPTIPKSVCGWAVVPNIRSEGGDDIRPHWLEGQQYGVPTATGDHSQFRSIVAWHEACDEWLSVAAWVCMLKDQGSMTEMPRWSGARTHCAHHASNVLVYLPVLRMRRWESEDVINQEDSAGERSWDSDADFLTHIKRLSPSSKSEEQPWMHGLGITVCLSRPGPRSSLFGCVMYFMMMITSLLQQPFW